MGSVPKLVDPTYAERLVVVDGTGVPKSGGRSPHGHWAVSQRNKTQLMQRHVVVDGTGVPQQVAGVHVGNFPDFRIQLQIYINLTMSALTISGSASTSSLL